jgi:hypothetical protein
MGDKCLLSEGIKLHSSSKPLVYAQTWYMRCMKSGEDELSIFKRPYYEDCQHTYVKIFYFLINWVFSSICVSDLIAIFLTLVKFVTQLQFLVDQPCHETSVLPSFQSFQPVTPDIDANTSPPFNADHIMPSIQIIQKQITHGTLSQDIVQI